VAVKGAKNDRINQEPKMLENTANFLKEDSDKKDSLVVKLLGRDA
jgi:hypothetical protein